MTWLHGAAAAAGAGKQAERLTRSFIPGYAGTGAAGMIAPVAYVTVPETGPPR